MITETKVKNTGDNEQVCHNFIDDSFNDRGNRYNFFCLENKMSR